MFGMTKFHTAVLALIIANIFWGATPPIFKWALEEISPFTLAFSRFFIASLIIFPFVMHKNVKIIRHDWPNVFVLVFFGVFLNISFFLLGLELTSSINAPIIASAGPVFLMIAGIFILREKPGIKKIAGGLMSLLGVVIIILLPVLGNGTPLDGSVLGNIFLVLATLASITHAVALKKIIGKYSPIVLVFWTFVIASLMFSPMFFKDVLDGAVANIGMQGILGIIYGAIFASAISYFLFTWAIKYLLAAEVGLFTYLDPVVAVLIAAPLLGEHPTPIYLLGAILVFLGIYIAEGRIHYHPIHLFRR
jgi:drug/metabolite transporter (DMT)-like permease